MELLTRVLTIEFLEDRPISFAAMKRYMVMPSLSHLFFQAIPVAVQQPEWTYDVCLHEGHLEALYSAEMAEHSWQRIMVDMDHTLSWYTSCK